MTLIAIMLSLFRGLAFVEKWSNDNFNFSLLTFLLMFKEISWQDINK